MSNKGFTLMECMVALGLLIVGGLATAQLVTVLGTSSTKVEGTTDAVALANIVIAQINDAKFVPADPDPGLAPGVYTVPAGGSTIQAVGQFPPGSPTMSVSYEVIACAICNDPLGDGQTGLGGVEVVVTVANISPHRKLRSPMRFFVRKEFAPTAADPTTIRGWLP